MKAISEYMDMPKRRSGMAAVKKHGSISVDNPILSYLKPTQSFLQGVSIRSNSRKNSSNRSNECESLSCSNRQKTQRSPPQSKTVIHPCLTSRHSSTKLDLQIQQIRLLNKYKKPTAAPGFQTAQSGSSNLDPNFKKQLYSYLAQLKQTIQQLEQANKDLNSECESLRTKVVKAKQKLEVKDKKLQEANYTLKIRQDQQL